MAFWQNDVAQQGAFGASPAPSGNNAGGGAGGFTGQAPMGRGVSGPLFAQAPTPPGASPPQAPTPTGTAYAPPANSANNPLLNLWKAGGQILNRQGIQLPQVPQMPQLPQLPSWATTAGAPVPGQAPGLPQSGTAWMSPPSQPQYGAAPQFGAPQPQGPTTMQSGYQASATPPLNRIG